MPVDLNIQSLSATAFGNLSSTGIKIICIDYSEELPSVCTVIKKQAEFAYSRLNRKSLKHFRACEHSVSEKVSDTYAGRQLMVPCPSLTRHTPQQSAAMESVAWITPVRDGASCEVALVAHFEAELRHAWLVTVREFKTCEKNREPEGLVRGKPMRSFLL